eukprot:3074227-Rhodomonas_salina.2
MRACAAELGRRSAVFGVGSLRGFGVWARKPERAARVRPGAHGLGGSLWQHLLKPPALAQKQARDGGGRGPHLRVWRTRVGAERGVVVEGRAARRVTAGCVCVGRRRQHQRSARLQHHDAVAMRLCRGWVSGCGDGDGCLACGAQDLDGADCHG